MSGFIRPTIIVSLPLYVQPRKGIMSISLIIIRATWKVCGRKLMAFWVNPKSLRFQLVLRLTVTTLFPNLMIFLILLINFLLTLVLLLNNKMYCIGVFIDLSKALTLFSYIVFPSLSILASGESHCNGFLTILLIDTSLLQLRVAILFVWILNMAFPRVLLLVHFSFSSILISFTLFADDTTIFYSRPQLSSLFNTLNTELTKVSEWFKLNKLSINHAKTNFIFFPNSTRPEDTSRPLLIIDGISITRVFLAKFLGVITDHKLSWFEHISSVNKLVCRNSGVISKICNFLPTSSLVVLYNTFIFPYLNYCNIVWASVSNTKMHSISQKRAIRICTFSSPREHSAPRFAQLHTLTIPDINKLYTGILMLKFINNLLPQAISYFFTSVQDTHSHSTRSCTNLYVPFTRTYSMHTIRFFGPRVWNAIDECIESQRSVGHFKSSLKHALISQYVS